MNFFWGVGFKEDRFWGVGGGGREWVVLVVGDENGEVKWWIWKEGKSGKVWSELVFEGILGW